MTDMPAPTFTKTFRRFDGDLIGGDFGWVASIDFLEEEAGEVGVEVIEETWERQMVSCYTILPDDYIELKMEERKDAADQGQAKEAAT